MSEWQKAHVVGLHLLSRATNVTGYYPLSSPSSLLWIFFYPPPTRQQMVTLVGWLATGCMTRALLWKSPYRSATVQSQFYCLCTTWRRRRPSNFSPYCIIKLCYSICVMCLESIRNSNENWKPTYSFSVVVTGARTPTQTQLIPIAHTDDDRI